MRKLDIVQGALMASLPVAVVLDFHYNGLWAFSHALLCACVFLAQFAFVYYRFTPPEFRDGAWWRARPMINIVLFLILNLVEWGAVLTTAKAWS